MISLNRDPYRIFGAGFLRVFAWTSLVDGGTGRFIYNGHSDAPVSELGWKLLVFGIFDDEANEFNEFSRYDCCLGHKRALHRIPNAV